MTHVSFSYNKGIYKLVKNKLPNFKEFNFKRIFTSSREIKQFGPIDS